MAGGLGAATLGLVSLAMGVMACGRSELKLEDFALASCGDGIVDEGEACDLGADNEDRFAIVLLHRGRRRPVMPVDRSASAVDFYDYTSESSHTGFEEVDLSATFLYRDLDTERLALVVHHGIDEDATGVTLEHGLVDMDLSGLPLETGVLVADEPDGEVTLLVDGEARGRWEFWRNSDGAVFGPIPFPGEWTIVMTVALRDGIERWVYVDEATERVALSPDREAILQARATPSACRTDCTIPRCGDGIVDGGEICDDGNASDGDGCASDCLSLQ